MRTTRTLTTREADLAWTQVSSHCAALKNWMATAVESDDMPKARELLKELREYEDLFSTLNGMREWALKMRAES